MKNATLILILFFSVFLYAQKIKNSSIIIGQKPLKKQGTQLVLKKVINDSRCPEGVNCIWFGEIEIMVSVYKNKKWIKDSTILLSPKKEKENVAFFGKYFPNKKVKMVGVLPYPKDGVKVNEKEYVIKIDF
jgi:hypothetical protein